MRKLRNVQCSEVLLKIPYITVEIRATRQNVRTQSISRPPPHPFPSSAVHNPSLYVIYTEMEVYGIDKYDSPSKQNAESKH
jgi:hypothetical protein